MKDTSKIVKFIIDFGNKVEVAYQGSLFLKLCRHLVDVWRDSVFGKIISGFFRYEIQNNSLFFKNIKAISNSMAKSIADFLSLKEAVNYSKYLSIIRNLTSRFKLKKELRFISIVKNSFFLNAFYDFWMSVD